MFPHWLLYVWHRAYDIRVRLADHLLCEKLGDIKARCGVEYSETLVSKAKSINKTIHLPQKDQVIAPQEPEGPRQGPQIWVIVML